MATDFSIGDIYDEALKTLSERRAEAGRASKAAYEKLDAQSREAYAGLNHEAYVNRALTERAHGTAGDGIATIRQRGESNLRNTLGKNERQRQSFEGSVDLALKNYETRQAADDAALSAQYGAAENAALLSQSNFDNQLGLKQQKLELDKQSSQLDHAYQLYARGMIDRGQFKDMTGIEVKKRPTGKKKTISTGPAVIYVGDQPPAQSTKGYVTRTEYIASIGLTRYYEVREDLVKDVDAKGVSLRDEYGSVKSEAQIYAEVHYEGYSGATAAQQAAILAANQEDFRAHFGVNYYTLYENYLTAFGDLLGLGLPELEPIKDVLRNYFDYTSTDENGEQGVFDDYNAACKEAVESIAGEYTDDISWEYLKECFPSIAEQFEYTGSADDRKREWLGVAPASFTSEALVDLLGETWGHESIRHSSFGPFQRTRSEILQELGVDLKTLSVQEILGISVYIDSVVNGSGLNAYPYVISSERRRMLEYGESVYNMYAVASLADGIPESFRNNYILNSGIYQGISLSPEEGMEIASRVWDNMAIEQKYEMAIGMLNEYSSFAQNAEVSEIDTIDEETQAEIELQIKQGLRPLYPDRYPPTEGNEDAEETGVKENAEDLEKTRMESVLGSSVAQEVIDSVLNNPDDYMTTLIPSDSDASYIELVDGKLAVEVIDFVINANWDTIEFNLTYGLEVGASKSNPKILGHSPIFDFGYVNNIYPFLTDTERNTLLYYYGTGETGNLTEYINIIEPILKERRIEYSEKTLKHEYEMLEQFVKQKGLEGEIKAATLSAAFSFLSASAYIDTLMAGIYAEEVDTTSEAQLIARRANDYAEIAKSSASNVFVRWVEDIAINMFKNLPYYFLGPVGPVLMGLNAAGQTAAQMNYQGYSTWESIGYSTAVGLIEAGTEYLAFKGVDVLGQKLLNSAAISKNLAKKMLKIVGGIGLKLTPQMGQEFTAGVLENILDAAFLGENSQYAAIRQQNIDAGMTAWEADYAAFLYQFFFSPLYQASVALGTGAGMGITSAVRYTGSVGDQIDSTDGMLQEEQLSNQERGYTEDLWTRLAEELNNQKETESEQSQKTQNDSSGVTKQMIFELSTLDSNTKASPEVTTAIGDFVVAMQEMGDAVPAEVYDTMMAAYRTFEASGTNGNAITVLNTVNQSIGDAIATGVLSGGDVTGLVELQGKLESALGSARQGSTQKYTIQAIANSVIDSFIGLSSEVISDTDYNALMSAYRTFEANASEANAAKVVEVAKQILGKMDIAQLEQAGVLKEEQARALEGLLEEIDSERKKEDNQVKKRGIVLLDKGYFQIINWTGYPEGEIPSGPFIMLEGEEYNAARKLANNVNASLHKQNSSYDGMQIHEIHPIKFGGSPTGQDNKIILTPPEHIAYTNFWNLLLKNLKG